MSICSFRRTFLYIIIILEHVFSLSGLFDSGFHDNVGRRKAGYRCITIGVYFVLCKHKKNRKLLMKFNKYNTGHWLLYA